MLPSKTIIVTIVGVLVLTSSRLVYGEVRNWLLLSYLSAIPFEHMYVAIGIGIADVTVARSEMRPRTLFLFTKDTHS